LNKDGGKRQFILITNNEKTVTTPEGIAYDVTSKRLKRVMTGECYDGTKDFKWNGKNKPLGDNLDVYDIATVAPYSDEPFTLIDETLYGKEKLGVKEKIQWVCENFEATQKKLEEK
jgi:adenine-specific DNA-methyltransferase